MNLSCFFPSFCLTSLYYKWPWTAKDQKKKIREKRTSKARNRGDASPVLFFVLIFLRNRERMQYGTFGALRWPRENERGSRAGDHT